jgi:hypothetical protein
VDPAALEEPFRDAFEEARTRILNGQLPDPLVPLGALVGGLLSGAGEAVAAQAMGQVASWLRGAAAGARRLEGAAHAVQAAIASVRGVVAGIDPDAFATRIGTGLVPLAAAVAALPAGAGRDRLAAAVGAVDLSADLRLLGPGRDRYLAFLETSETTLGDLVAKGFGEIDASAGAIRAALAPFASLLASPRAVLERLGFTRFDGGLTGLLAEMFEAAPPERLTGLLTPIYAALHDRLATLIAAILDPVRAFVDALIGIIALFDLAPITALLDEIFQQVRDEIAALHPDQLLGEAITAFTNAQAAFAAFDPLAPVIDLIETLQATIVRVLDLFDAESLLAVPIEVYDKIREILEALDLNGLLDPLYDRLDAIALQVTEGLDTTVAAFERLQDALPDTIGSTSVSGSVSVGAG